MDSRLLKPGDSSDETVWPQSMPGPDEKKFLSITVNEDCEVVWALHELDEEYGVHTFTSQFELDRDVLINSDRSQKLDILRAMLPKEGKNNKYNINDLHDFICPKPLESIDEEEIVPAAEITIYILGTNRLHEKLLVKIFRCISSRVFTMKSTDFFLKFERENLRVKVDRVAALRGSAHFHGFPAIVFDAGNVITYTAAGWDGRLIGEGVSCGLWQRLQCLSGSNSDLRTLSEERVEEVIKECITCKKPLSIFANNSEKSAIATGMSEVSNQARYSHRVWLGKVGLSEPKPEGEQKRDPFNFCRENNGRTASVIGKKRMFLTRLLKEKHGGLIECPKQTNQDSDQQDEEKIDGISMVYIPHLISYGIHNTILRMKHIIAEKGESVLTDFLTSSTKKYSKKETKSCLNQKKIAQSKSTNKHSKGSPTQKALVSQKKVVPDGGSDTKSKKSSKKKKSQEKKKKCSIVKKINSSVVKKINRSKEKKERRSKEKVRKRSQEEKEKSPRKKKKTREENDEVNLAYFSTVDPKVHLEKQKEIHRYFGFELCKGTVTRYSYTESQGRLWDVEYKDKDKEKIDDAAFFYGLKLIAKHTHRKADFD